MISQQFKQIIIKENNEPLVNLKNYDFILEPLYFKSGLSSTKEMFLRKTVAEKLVKLQKKLKKYKFKIWDGYRSRKVQILLYESYKQQLQNRYPSWPEKKLQQEVRMFIATPYDNVVIPPHTTGGTIDLTLVDEQGKELNMGTSFDFFGEEALPFYFDDKDEIISNNRKILREAMFSEEFSINKHEWWHFNYRNMQWAKDLGKNVAVYGEIKQ